MFNHADEDADLNLTYAQVETLNKFRNERLCGPFSMFDNLTEFWPDMDLDVLHETVQKFFTTYANNRHKSVVMTPALFMSTHSCDSNKYDYRPYLYSGFEYQFNKMDRLKEQIMMSNVTKQHKNLNIRHAYVGSSKDLKNQMMSISDLKDNMKEGRDATSRGAPIKVPDPFDFAEKGMDQDIDVKMNLGQTYTPDPEPMSIKNKR